MAPFYIMNLYAHSAHVQRQERNNFFKGIVDILLSMPEILSHLIMAGDFNYSFDSDSRHGSRIRKSKEFVQFMAGYMKDYMNQEEEEYGSTCRQNRQGRISLSTIDYLFVGKELLQRMNSGDVEFFSQEFTDHALLTKTLTMEMYSCGKGIWRTNPYLCKNKRYVSNLNREIESFIQNKLNPDLSTQDQWDCLKNMVKKSYN
jgi:endonuclease/exonuclease/phosphatase family metal-dependent hydrolase